MVVDETTFRRNIRVLISLHVKGRCPDIFIPSLHLVRKRDAGRNSPSFRRSETVLEPAIRRVIHSCLYLICEAISCCKYEPISQDPNVHLLRTAIAGRRAGEFLCVDLMEPRWKSNVITSLQSLMMIGSVAGLSSDELVANSRFRP